MSERGDCPPGPIRRVLRRLFPGPRGTEVLEGLDREYSAVRERSGRAVACGWYLLQLLRPATWRLAWALRRIQKAEDAASAAAGRQGRARSWMSGRFISGVLHDARYALRGLRRSPAFTVVVLASLAVGIGANAAMSSFVNAVLIKQLPVREPDRLVTFTRTSGAASSPVVWSLTTIEELSKRLPALGGAFGWFTRPISWSAGDGAQSQWVNAELATGQYFRTMQVRPTVGRLLDEDDVRDAAAVCVLSYAFWQRVFGGDPSVTGRTVFLNGYPYRVIGVTEQSFLGAQLQRRFDVVIPATRIGDFMPTFAGSSGKERLRRMSWLATPGTSSGSGASPSTSSTCARSRWSVRTGARSSGCGWLPSSRNGSRGWSPPTPACPLATRGCRRYRGGFGGPWRRRRPWSSPASCRGAAAPRSRRRSVGPTMRRFRTSRTKAGPRAMPSLVPTAPDDPATEANRAAAWQPLSEWRRPFLVAFSGGDPITGGMAPILKEVVPGAHGRDHPTIEGAGHFLLGGCGGAARPRRRRLRTFPVIGVLADDLTGALASAGQRIASGGAVASVQSPLSSLAPASPQC